MSHVTRGRFTCGRLSYRCPSCGFTVTVRKPDLVINAETTRATRKLYSDAIRRQIPFDACCEQCAERWNQVLRTLLEGRKRSDRCEGRGP